MTLTYEEINIKLGYLKCIEFLKSIGKPEWMINCGYKNKSCIISIDVAKFWGLS